MKSASIFALETALADLDRRTAENNEEIERGKHMVKAATARNKQIEPGRRDLQATLKTLQNKK